MAKWPSEQESSTRSAGVGAGGYQAWANGQDPKASIHAHAHNSVLQMWSTLGAVGVLLWVVDDRSALLRSAWD